MYFKADIMRNMGEVRAKEMYESEALGWKYRVALSYPTLSQNRRKWERGKGVRSVTVSEEKPSDMLLSACR